MTKFEVGKTYVTRDGREARILMIADENKQVNPLIGAIRTNDVWCCADWRADGSYSLGGSSWDLSIPKAKKYICVYQYRANSSKPWTVCTSIRDTKEDAEKRILRKDSTHSTHQRRIIRTIEVEVEE